MSKTITPRIKGKEHKTLAECPKDEGLIKGVKQGINDAKAGRGRFVTPVSHRKEAYRYDLTI